MSMSISTSHRRWVVAALVTVAAVLVAVPASAGVGGERRVETGWYEGRTVSFLQPSVFSANANGGVFACFDLGPDLAAVTRPTNPLYVILDDTATQDHCDGDATALRHDHVLSVAPGDAGYTGAWTLVLLVEASPRSIDLGTHPFASAAEVQAAMASGTLVDVSAALSPTPVTMVAPVIAGASAH